MTGGASGEITALLHAWGGGDREALERLAPLVDIELRNLARRCLGGKRSDPMLETTALVNEAYLRLIGHGAVDFADRARFYALCARIMRRVLVDNARARLTGKRGAGMSLLSLDEDLAMTPERTAGLVAIDDALEALAKIDARKARVVELRFFAGLSVEESAEALSVSPGTVRRDWRLARAWLLREIRGAP